MKVIACHILCLISFAGISQNIGIYSTFSNNLKPYTFSLGIIPKSVYNNPNALTIYNPMTQMNDNYNGFNGNYYMSNIKSFSFYSYNGVRMDSFNPYGSTTMKSALTNGILGYLGLDPFIMTPPRE